MLINEKNGFKVAKIDYNNKAEMNLKSGINKILPLHWK